VEPDDYDPDEDVAALSDEELDRELTIAASDERRRARYEALLAELDRRRGADPRD
jgi:hypothetical protein